MLGDLIVEEQGHVTATRVLSDTETEVSYQADGTIYGTQMTDVGTYRTFFLPDGTLWGDDGQGMVMTADGEMLTYRGQGVARLGKGGATTWRGAVYFRTGSEKLAHANALTAPYELEIDADGSMRIQVWEWK